MLPDLYTSMEDNWLDSIVRFTLVLESYAPPQKIPTIRVIRELTSLGLADAKVVSESVPLPLLRFHLREHGDWARSRFDTACARCAIHDRQVELRTVTSDWHSQVLVKMPRVFYWPVAST
jgi:hypothetical protein